MKRLLFVFLLAVCTSGLMAQSRSFSPTNGTSRTEFTVTFDLSTGPFAGYSGDDLYIWAWSNVGDAASNGGDWNADNIQQGAKLTRVSGDIWQLTFVPYILWGKAPAEMTFINFLVRKADGTAQTGDFGEFPLDPLPYERSSIVVSPSKFSGADVVTLQFDYALYRQNNSGSGLTTNPQTDLYIYSACQYETWDGTNWVRSGDWQQEINGVRISPSWDDITNNSNGILRMKNLGNDKYEIRFIPNQFFGMAPNQRVVKVNLIIRAKDSSGQTGDLQLRTIEF